jgi:hypothetical protein
MLLLILAQFQAFNDPIHIHQSGEVHIPNSIINVLFGHIISPEETSIYLFGEEYFPNSKITILLGHIISQADRYASEVIYILAAPL